MLDLQVTNHVLDCVSGFSGQPDRTDGKGLSGGADARGEDGQSCLGITDARHVNECLRLGEEVYVLAGAEIKSIDIKSRQSIGLRFFDVNLGEVILQTGLGLDMFGIH